MNLTAFAGSGLLDMIKPKIVQVRGNAHQIQMLGDYTIVGYETLLPQNTWS